MIDLSLTNTLIKSSGFSKIWSAKVCDRIEAHFVVQGLSECRFRNGNGPSPSYIILTFLSVDWRMVLTWSYCSFQDRHVKDASRDPQMDLSQDYCLLLGYENKTHTILRFSRRYDTCDPRDLKITVGGLIYKASGVKDNFVCPREVLARGSLDGFTGKIEPATEQELFIVALWEIERGLYRRENRRPLNSLVS